MKELGFKASGDTPKSSLWNPSDRDIDEALPGNSVANHQTNSAVVSQKGLLPAVKPKGVQRVLEFLVYMNAESLNRHCMRTSEIAAMLFPDVDKQVMEGWVIRALDECLYRIGYSPVYDDGTDEADPLSDPEWFCDGDPKDALFFNLWKGLANQKAKGTSHIEA